MYPLARALRQSGLNSGQALATVCEGESRAAIGKSINTQKDTTNGWEKSYGPLDAVLAYNIEPMEWGG